MLVYGNPQLKENLTEPKRCLFTLSIWNYFTRILNRCMEALFKYDLQGSFNDIRIDGNK